MLSFEGLRKSTISPQAAVSGRLEDEEKRTVSTDGKAETSFDPLVFGRQFCQWFFQLLNSQNLSLGQQPQDWGPQHFWPDARLRLFCRYIVLT